MDFYTLESCKSLKCNFMQITVHKICKFTASLFCIPVVKLICKSKQTQLTSRIAPIEPSLLLHAANRNYRLMSCSRPFKFFFFSLKIDRNFLKLLLFFAVSKSPV